jgi:hypothetical protein
VCGWTLESSRPRPRALRGSHSLSVVLPFVVSVMESESEGSYEQFLLWKRRGEDGYAVANAADDLVSSSHEVNVRLERVLDAVVKEQDASASADEDGRLEHDEANGTCCQCFWITVVVFGLIVTAGVGISLSILSAPILVCASPTPPLPCRVESGPIPVELDSGLQRWFWTVSFRNNSTPIVATIFSITPVTYDFTVGAWYNCSACGTNKTGNLTTLASVSDMGKLSRVTWLERPDLPVVRFVNWYVYTFIAGIVICFVALLLFVLVCFIWRCPSEDVPVMKKFDNGAQFWRRGGTMWYGDGWHLLVRRLFVLGKLANSLDIYLSATIGVFLVIQFDNFTAGASVMIPLIVFVLFSGTTVDFRLSSFFLVESDKVSEIIIRSIDDEDHLVVSSPNTTSVFVHEFWFWSLWGLSTCLETGQLMASIVALSCQAGQNLPACSAAAASPLASAILSFSLLESTLRLVLLCSGMLFRLREGNVLTLWKILSNQTNKKLSAESLLTIAGSCADENVEDPVWRTGVYELQLEAVRTNDIGCCC